MDLVKELRHVFIMGRHDTLGERVLISFMVAQGLLSLIPKLLDQILALSILVVFKGRAHRVVNLLVELSLLQLVGEVVDVVNHQVRAKFWYDLEGC